MSADGLNGITVGGKPVTKYIVEKEVEQKTKEARADFDQKKSRAKKGLGNCPKTKIKSKNTSKSGNTNYLPRRQINREYWRNNMDTSSIMKMIIAVLLKGEKYTATEMHETIISELQITSELTKYKKIRKGDISSRFSQIRKTELGALLIREDISATSRPVYKWSFVAGALDMRPEELIGLYKKRNNEHTLFKLTNDYPFISGWLKEIKWGGIHDPKKKVVQKKVPLPHKEGKTASAPTDRKASADKIVDIIGTVVSKAIEEHSGGRIKVDIGIKIRFGLLPEIVEYKNR